MQDKELIGEITEGIAVSTEEDETIEKENEIINNAIQKDEVLREVIRENQGKFKIPESEDEQPPENAFGIMIYNSKGEILLKRYGKGLWYLYETEVPEDGDYENSHEFWNEKSVNVQVNGLHKIGTLNPQPHSSCPEGKTEWHIFLQTGSDFGIPKGYAYFKHEDLISDDNDFMSIKQRNSYKNFYPLALACLRKLMSYHPHYFLVSCVFPDILHNDHEDKKLPKFTSPSLSLIHI